MPPAPSSLSLAVFFVLALLPMLCLWLMASLHPPDVEKSAGLVTGNPLTAAPLAPVLPMVAQPLVHLTRSLSGAEVEGYILGLRHLPLEQAAPLLKRFALGHDPALQLYAQSILQSGRDRLSARFHQLQASAASAPSAAAWTLEAGLSLTHPAHCSSTERHGRLQHLATLADELLARPEPSPALLTNAVRVYLAAGLPHKCEALLAQLPGDSPLRRRLAPAVAHALHTKALA